MSQIDFFSNLVVPAFVSSGSALLALHFLGRRIVSHVLSKDLEKFKNTLTIRSMEHAAVFSGLHERRANILADFYRALIGFELFFEEHADADSQLLTLDNGLRYSEEISERLREVKHTYLENKILFPERTCELIESLITVLQDVKQSNVAMEIKLTTGETANAIRIPSGSGIVLKIAPVKIEVEQNIRAILGSADKN